MESEESIMEALRICRQNMLEKYGPDFFNSNCFQFQIEGLDKFDSILESIIESVPKGEHIYLDTGNRAVYEKIFDCIDDGKLDQYSLSIGMFPPYDYNANIEIDVEDPDELDSIIASAPEKSYIEVSTSNPAVIDKIKEFYTRDKFPYDFCYNGFDDQGFPTFYSIRGKLT